MAEENDALARGTDDDRPGQHAAGRARRSSGSRPMDDEVDRAHVDAELERGSRHERRQAAGLELLLDLGRCSRAIDPWWARTSSSPANSLSRWASRSDSRRLFVKTIVLRCS